MNSCRNVIYIDRPSLSAKKFLWANQIAPENFLLANHLLDLFSKTVKGKDHFRFQTYTLADKLFIPRPKQIMCRKFRKQIKAQRTTARDYMLTYPYRFLADHNP